jgi:hypothetical protein
MMISKIITTKFFCTSSFTLAPTLVSSGISISLSLTSILLFEVAFYAELPDAWKSLKYELNPARLRMFSVLRFLAAVSMRLIDSMIWSLFYSSCSFG